MSARLCANPTFKASAGRMSSTDWMRGAGRQRSTTKMSTAPSAKASATVSGEKR